MDELTRQKEQEKLRQEIGKVENARHQAFGPDAYLQMDQAQAASMQEGARYMERVGIQGLDERDMLTPLRQVELPAIETSIQADVEKREKQRKKQREQEQDARRRAQTQGVAYATNVGGDMQRAVVAHKERAGAEPLSGDWKGIQLGLTGQEFTPDPETGAVDLAGMLEKRRRMAAQQKLAEQSIRAGERLPVTQQCVLEANAQILGVLDDAIRTWWAANGVNDATGGSVSKSKAAAAQQHLALAMENYRQAMAETRSSIGHKMIDKVLKERSEDYRGKMRESEHRDRSSTEAVVGLNMGVASINKDDITAIRGWISENPEAYHQNKAQVDRIYGEFLASAQEYGHAARHISALDSLIRGGKTTINENTATGMAMEVIEKERQKIGSFRQLQERQKDALNFLLRGREPDNVVSAVYLERQWGIVTGTRAEMKRQEAMVELLEGANESFETERYGVDMQRMERERQRAYEGVRRQYAVELAQARADTVAYPRDELLALRKTKLERGNPNGRATDLMAAMAVSRPQELELKYLNDKFFTGAYKTNGADYRDVARMVQPIGHAAEADLSDMCRANDNITIIQQGTRLDGTPAGGDQRLVAIREEVEMHTAAMEDVKAFIDARPQYFHNPDMTPAERIAGYPSMLEVHNKVQMLSSRGKAMERSAVFQELSGEEQEEIRALQGFFHGAMMYVRNMQAVIEEEAQRPAQEWEEIENVHDTLADSIQRLRPHH